MIKTLGYCSDLRIAQNILCDLHKRYFKGSDPSTIAFSPKILNLVAVIDKFPFSYYLKALLGRTFLYGGHRLNFLIKPAEIVLPKCLALAVMAHVNCYRLSLNDVHLCAANKLLDRLLEFKLPDKMVWSHGYPYKIRGQRIYLNTPNLVTTFFVSEAFYYVSKHLNCKSANAYYHEIVKDSLLTFPFNIHQNFGCFMYTPNSNYYVHNANLMMVEMVSKSWAENAKEPPPEAELALIFTLSHFEDSKALPYAGGKTPNDTEDNYHTGYILRSLIEIMNSRCFPLLDHRIKYCLKLGINRYFKLFVGDRFIYRDKKGIINSHSLAEAILFKKIFKNYFNHKEKSALDNAIKNTQNFLWNNAKGYFINLAAPIIGCTAYIKDRSYFPRWSQAWMARALSEPDERLD